MACNCKWPGTITKALRGTPVNRANRELRVPMVLRAVTVSLPIRFGLPKAMLARLKSFSLLSSVLRASVMSPVLRVNPALPVKREKTVPPA